MILNLPKPFQVRPAEIGDADALYIIHRSAMREYVDRIWGWNDEWQKSEFLKNFDSLNNRFVICNVDGPIGFMCLKSEPDTIFIKTVELAVDYQGCGIASALLDQLSDIAKESGKSLRLQVFQINDRARCLYERLGFTVMGQTEHHYQMERSAS